MTNPADFWNPKFETEEYIFGTEANSFIKAVIPPAGSGQTAYAPADGEGRNGVYLAEIGYQVTSTDIADKAVDKAKKLAQSRGVTVNAMVGDIMADPPGQFDVVIVSFMHFRPDDHLRFVQHLIKAMAPGGLLALEGYSLDQIPLTSGGPKSPDMLYTRDQLTEDFAALDIQLIQETKRVLNEGPRHQGEAATIQLIAKKDMGHE
jgi:SAM-dependent methyltransferase